MYKCLITVVILTLYGLLSSSSFAANTSDDNVVIVPRGAAAEKPFVGSFDVASNYVYRGLTQTSNLPAFQGGFTYSFKSGFYLNIWGSNVNFNAGLNSHATVEFDTIIGFGRPINDDWHYNISLERYNYPRATERIITN